MRLRFVLLGPDKSSPFEMVLKLENIKTAEDLDETVEAYLTSWQESGWVKIQGKHIPFHALAYVDVNQS